MIGPAAPDPIQMERALEQARLAAKRNEVPVGAVLLAPDGQLLAAAGNETEARHDASAHAEMLVMRAAAQALVSPRLTGCTLVVTLEPCPMCAAAAALFRVGTIIFGAYDPKGGGIEHGPRLLAAPEIIGGVREREAAELLQAFFKEKRKKAVLF